MNNPFIEIDARLSNIELLLQGLKSEPKKTEILKDLNPKLSLKQLQDYLPEHPAKQTVYGWCSNRKIPFQKHGSKLFFLKSDIDRWLSNGRQVSHLKGMEA